MKTTTIIKLLALCIFLIEKQSFARQLSFYSDRNLIVPEIFSKVWSTIINRKKRASLYRFTDPPEPSTSKRTTSTSTTVTTTTTTTTESSLTTDWNPPPASKSLERSRINSAESFTDETDSLEVSTKEPQFSEGRLAVRKPPQQPYKKVKPKLVHPKERAYTDIVPGKYGYITRKPPTLPTPPEPTQYPVEIATKPAQVQNLLCKQLSCKFDTDLCQWTKGSTERGFRRYNADAIVGNMDTGVNAQRTWNKKNFPEVSITPFGAIALNPEEKSILESPTLNVEEAVELRFNYYEATVNSFVQVCLNDDLNCKFMSNPGNNIDDRKWRPGSTIIPPGTTKVFIIADNFGKYFGAAGIDDITVVKPFGNDPQC